MRVLIADDQKRVRSALRLLIEHGMQGEILASEAEDVPGLLAVAQEHSLDLLLLNWELPGLQSAGLRSPLELLAELRTRFPRLVIVVMNNWPEECRAACEAGADESISKGDSPEGLLCKLNRVLETQPR